MHGLGIVAVSLVPFACGVVNVMVAAQTWSDTVAGSHRGGAMLFLGAGVLLGVVGLVRLVAAGDSAAIAAALLVLALEVAVVSCLGVAALWH
jgi:hypothetical protein